MNLDPNKIDFSSVNSPLDLVLALEKSNPDFLNIKPYGVTKMKVMRTSLRKSLSSFAELMENAVNFLGTIKLQNNDLPGKNSLNIISDFNNYIHEVNMDFQEPDSTTIIDGTVVNLSAWFDVPPTNFLQKLKWYLDTDSTKDQTLGGLFPEANKGTDVQQCIPLPSSYKLYQNYPNPFNPSTTISYDVPKSGMVTIKIYNILGKEICTLLNEEKQAGSYKIEFSTNNFLLKLSSGIYFYRMKSGNFSETKKLILLK